MFAQTKCKPFAVSRLTTPYTYVQASRIVRGKRWAVVQLT